MKRQITDSISENLTDSDLERRLMIFCRSQVEKSEARRYLQLAQYCASYNRGVMPVLPVNTVPYIGVLLAYYWRSTGAAFFGRTGQTLK